MSPVSAAHAAAASETQIRALAVIDACSTVPNLAHLRGDEVQVRERMHIWPPPLFVLIQRCLKAFPSPHGFR